MNPVPTYNTSEVSMGVATSPARLKSGSNFVTTKASNPPIIDTMAAVLPLRLNKGSNPRIIGMAIGPNNEANHETINPKTPPKCRKFIATMMVNRVNEKVVIRAMMSACLGVNFRTRGIATGKISRVITADTVLESEEVIDNVLANIEASTNPSKPAGKNLIAIMPYDKVGSAKSLKKMGAANMGNNRTNGHTK